MIFYLSIGSNIEPEKNISFAIKKLNELLEDLIQSSIIISKAEGLQRRFTRPPDLHAPKEIGLGAGKAIESFRLKVRIGPKNLGIRVKMYGGASAVRDLALIGQLAGGNAPRVTLRP